MNLDELRSVQADERRTDGLQPLPDAFYAEAGTFIQERKAERSTAAAEAADPFGSDAVRQLSDEIETAEEVVESIWNRRVGKIVKQASLAADGTTVDTEALTDEERDLFRTLVDDIESGREVVLDAINPDPDANAGPVDAPDADSVGGAGPAPSPSDATDPADAARSAGAVDAGRDASTAPDDARTPPDRAPAADSAPGEPPASGDTTARPGDSEPPSPAPDGGAARPEPAPDATADRHDGPPTDDRPDRTTVRITDDVGSILGVDERTYDLAHDDVVTLPDPNAGALVESGAAERID